jgi:Holliday junction resolvase
MNSISRSAAREARGVSRTDQHGGKVNRKNSLSPSTVQAQRGGRRSRAKGARLEREIVSLHLGLGIHSERVPFSGAVRYKGNGADVDVYCFGREEPPVVSEVKARKTGAGFKTLERWIGDKDAIFLRRNHGDPIIALPWKTWVALLARVRR